MTIDQAVSSAITWLRRAVVVTLLAMLAITLVKAAGIIVPIREPAPLDLVYLAGVYWLTK